jgi:hypothetical protein
MSPEVPLPKLEYLVECPDSAVQEIELKLLDLAAQCMKRAKVEWEQAVAYREGAGVCRWLIVNRDDMIGVAKRIADGRQGLLRFPEFPQGEFSLTRKTA